MTWVLVVWMMQETASMEKHRSQLACEMARTEVEIIAKDAVRWSYCLPYPDEFHGKHYAIKRANA